MAFIQYFCNMIFDIFFKYLISKEKKSFFFDIYILYFNIMR